MNGKLKLDWEAQERFIAEAALLVREKFGPEPKAYVHSFGCQQNVSDGQRLSGILARIGFTFCPAPEDGADLVVYNTCAVRGHAEDRVFGNTGALRQLKEQKKQMIIGLVGCMMQQAHIAEKIKKSYPHVNFVLGTSAEFTLPEVLCGILSGGGRVFDLRENEEITPEEAGALHSGGPAAYLPVMYGCDNFCSYCIVPLVRGRERSRQPADILAEANRLLQSGVREITLLGQNVNSYGKGLGQQVSFAALLQKICDLPGEFRIRFMTSHPKDMTKELIDTIADNEKIERRLHLPVQSGSNNVLSRMNRKYSTEEYLSLIDYARNEIPEIVFSSDIIVGFPGETEADFEATMELVRRVKYSQLFTFIYSKRNGTSAAKMPDETPKSEKSARMQRLLDQQLEISAEVCRSFLGQTCRVLCMGAGKKKGFMTGRNSQNVAVEFKGPENASGKFFNVTIKETSASSLSGEISGE